MHVKALEYPAAAPWASSPELDQRLRAVTDEAMSLGVFGIPTIVVADRVVWGNDQFEMAGYFVEQEKQAVPA